MGTTELGLIGLALAPVFVIGIYIYARDKHEKEPLSLMAKCFALGVLSIFPAMLFETFFGFLGWGVSPNILATALFAWIGVGWSEEFSKYIFLKKYAYKLDDFNEPYDGIVYTVMIGLGFAAAENIMYVMNASSIQESLTIAMMRAFTAVPAHAAFAIIMGYYAGIAKFSHGNKAAILMKGLFWAIVLHGAYDFFLFTNNYIGMGLGALVSLVMGLLSLKAMRLHQKNSPFNPENGDFVS